MVEKLIIRLSGDEELGERFRELQARSRTKNYREFIRGLLDLYEILSERYKEKDIAKLVLRVKHGVVVVD